MIVIDLGFGVIGVELEHGRVVRAPPIAQYMAGWTRGQVIAYARDRRWKIVEIGEGFEPHGKT